MKNLTSIFTLLFVSFGLTGQVSVTEIKTELFGNPYDVSNQAHINNLKVMESMNQKSLNNIYSDWQTGTITDYDNNVYSVDSLNFNADHSLFLFYKDGKYLSLKGDQVKQVAINDRIFKRVKNMGFCEYLSDGKIPLIKSYQVVEVKSYSSPMAMPGTEQYKNQIDEKIFYYNAPKKSYDKLPRKKSDLLKVFGSKRNKVLDFARANKLSNKREKDLVLIFDHYNSLEKKQ